MRTNSVFVCAILLVMGCSPIHRLDLYAGSEEKLSRVKIESTQVFAGSLLDRPLGNEHPVPGDGQVILLKFGFRSESAVPGSDVILDFDDYLRYHLFIEWPGEIKSDTVTLKDRSFAWAQGRFEQTDDQRLFTAATGEVIVDSLVKREAFCTLDGRYISNAGTEMTFRGRFRLKIIK